MQVSLDGEVTGDFCFYFCLYTFQYFAIFFFSENVPFMNGEKRTVPGRCSAATSKSNTYCFCTTTRRKRLVVFLKGGRKDTEQSYKTSCRGESGKKSSEKECEGPGQPATSDCTLPTDTSCCTHKLHKPTTLLAPYRATQPSAQATRKKMKQKNQQVQLRTNSTKTFGSSHEGRPPSPSRFRRATHRDSVISPTAQPRSSTLPGEEAGPNGTLYTQKLVINSFISPEGLPPLTSLSSPAPQATPFFL